MIFNQMKFERAKRLETITDPDSDDYEKVMAVVRDCGFAKQVFLGYVIVDDWDGTPCVWMERAP